MPKKCPEYVDLTLYDFWIGWNETGSSRGQGNNRKTERQKIGSDHISSSKFWFSLNSLIAFLSYAFS